MSEQVRAAAAGTERSHYLDEECPMWCDGFHEEPMNDASRVHMCWLVATGERVFVDGRGSAGDPC